jgi:hypothetical protein
MVCSVHAEIEGNGQVIHILVHIPMTAHKVTESAADMDYIPAARSIDFAAHCLNASQTVACQQTKDGGCSPE